MPSHSDETGQSAPAPDTAQFPLAGDDTPPPGGGKPAHSVTTDAPGITRGGWWAITITAAALLIIGFLLTFGPARYWTPVPVVFLGYFLISGLIGLVFWKGVRELRDSNPTLHSGDGPASPGQRVAAAIGAVGIASALILLPMSLSDAPANAAPCPDGSQTCGPAPTQDPGPTQGNGGNTTAPQAPNTTVPGYTPPDTLAPPQGNGSGNTFQGTARPMPTPDQVDPNACIANCGPTQAPQQAPQTGQANPPQNGQQSPVTTAPNTVATTPHAPTTTPKLRTPTPETAASTTSSKARDRDDQSRDKDEDRDKNSGIPYQASWLAGVGGTYRRKKPDGVEARVAMAAWEYVETYYPSPVYMIEGAEQKYRVSIDGAWDALNECFNCVFPIGGAPKAMPKVGDFMPLSIGAGGHISAANIPFPLKVTQIEKSADEINIEYETLEGHPDGAGSTIHFKIVSLGGEALKLVVTGKILGGPGAAAGSVPGGQTIYRESAGIAWQKFINNLTVKGAAKTPPPGISYA
ncbi:hypothetical protein [Tsukamurella pseudospumae]|uniref:Uncharacterized protein n=1 Tax=Tsukamurella pseudospumae TaxID=239498 RepID=A0A138AE43_9ACTN|nr:hypothetical protein [Tsukamurella pseudospumae]KXP08724.1 hypothetical protein AXK60_08600 [Tsukamurella pseudospumae]